MDLKALQKKVDCWIKTNGVNYFDELTNTILLMEEVGELARIIARVYGQQSIKKGVKLSDLDSEIADVLFVLLCIANQTGVDLQSAIEKNMKLKAKRDKERHHSNLKIRRD